MRNKSVVRLTISLILVVALVGSFTITAFATQYPNNASHTFADGDRTYEAYMSKTANSEFIKPITDTQVYHTKGIETSIGITKGYATTWTGSGEITTGYSGVFVDLSGTIGVSKSTSYSLSVSVGYVIPASRESGYYRIEQRCPKYTVWELLSDISDDGIATVFTKTLQNMPGKNEGYYMITRYQ